VHADLSGGAIWIVDEMASSDQGKGKDKETLSPRSARAKLEEALGKLNITDVEATPLVVDDREEGAQRKWLLAGKVLHRKVFHIQTIISALRPAWGNPKGLQFRSVGENMFVAEFATQQDRDRVWDGSPWHVSNNAVILCEFEEYMKPAELRFDRLQLWVRVMNLPFNLRDNKWWLMIARQIDEKAEVAYFDHVGGYLRARITVDVANPLRRCILIQSARRKGVDMYEVQYEQIPHFCFSCGRLGHSDLICSTPGTRDANGDLPYGKGLRAADERKRAYSEGSSGGQSSAPNTKAETRNSSTAGDKSKEVTSPVKKFPYKRKAGVQQQIYRKVVPQLMNTPSDIDADGRTITVNGAPVVTDLNKASEIAGEEPDPKKKKPTPTTSETSAAAASQRCQSQ
jgi:hypothetical protein